MLNSDDNYYYNRNTDKLDCNSGVDSNSKNKSIRIQKTNKNEGSKVFLHPCGFSNIKY